MNAATKIENQSFNAVLNQDISYRKDGVEITVPAQTFILVDTAQNVALIGNDHVDVTPEEYTLS